MGEACEVIYAYTRAQAIEDGVLVDVSETAREAGFKYPVAVTRAVWERYCEAPAELPCQDTSGRLWDLCFMMGMAARRHQGGPEMRFEVIFQKPDVGDWKPWEKPTDGERLMRTVTLKSVCGPGDRAEPVVTVMLPDED
jgi:hypothetical protein